MQGLLGLGLGILEACCFMQKFRMLMFVLLPLFLVACGGQSKDELKPALNLTGETTRTVNASSVVIEGTLSDNIKVTSFLYGLNNDKPKDVLQFLKDKTFKFTVDGLSSGDNKIMLIATDVTGNQVELEVKVTVQTPANPTEITPTLSGRWKQEKITLTACGESYTLYLFFDVRQKGEQVNGLLKIDSSLGGISASLVEGTISETGLLQGTARYYDAVIKLQLEGNTLEGTITFHTYDCDWEPFDQIVNVVFQKTDDVFTIPMDDTLEPNNRMEQASAIEVDARKDLIFTYMNFDWFSFTLNEARDVTVKVTEEVTDSRHLNVKLFDAANNEVMGRSGDDFNPTTTWSLKAGTYYLRLEMSVFETLAIDYKLELSSVVIPEDAYEPNDSFQEARPISFNTTHNLYLFQNNEDWFTFFLQETSSLTVATTTYSYVELTLYNDKHEDMNFNYDHGFVSTEVTLNPGKYYLRATGIGVADSPGFAYTLKVDSRAIIANDSEPNDTFEQAVPVAPNVAYENAYFAKGDTDWFRFNLDKMSLVSITLDQNDWDSIRLYEYKNGNLNLVESGSQFYSEFVFEAGTYYLEFGQAFNLSGSFSYGFKVSAKDVPDLVYEPNDGPTQATPLTMGIELSNILASDNNDDWFTFTINTASSSTFDVNRNSVNIFLYNQALNSIPIQSWNAQSFTQMFQAGKYYIKITPTYQRNFYSLRVSVMP
jgi:hypothetical protein